LTADADGFLENPTATDEGANLAAPPTKIFISFNGAKVNLVSLQKNGLPLALDPLDYRLDKTAITVKIDALDIEEKEMHFQISKLNQDILEVKSDKDDIIKLKRVDAPTSDISN
jgi:hypothetical protein